MGSFFSFAKGWEKHFLNASSGQMLALDLGSANTRIMLQTKVIYSQPTCIAIHLPTQTVVALGEKAYQLLGKTPSFVEVHFPIQKGVISHPTYARLYIESLRAELKINSFWDVILRQSVRCAVPSVISPLERSLFEQTFHQSGFVVEKLVPKSEALARKLKRPEHQESALCVIDLGSQTTEIIFFSGKSPVVSQTLPFGMQRFTQAIKETVRREHHCEIGWHISEKIQYQLAAIPPVVSQKIPEQRMTVRGKDVVENIPVTIQVTNTVLSGAMQPLAEEMMQGIKQVLGKVPSDLLALALENGVFLTGGGSQLKGLGEFISFHLHTHFLLSATPLEDVVQGIKE